MQYLDSLYLTTVGHISRAVGKVAMFLGGEVNLKEITEGDASGGTFENVVTSATGLSQDLYTTLMVIGGFGGVLMLIIAFIFFAIAGSGAKKDEAKGKIATVLLAVAGVFAAVFIVGLAQKIGIAFAEQQTE